MRYVSAVKRRLEQKLKFTFKLFLLSQILSVGLIQVGFGLGFPSPTLSQLRTLRLLDAPTYPVYISLFVAGMAIGNALSIPGSKYLGRKLVAMVSSVSITAGLLLIAAATNSAFLLAGRLFHGVGAGMVLAIIPVYLGEISPPGARGFLSGFEGVYDVSGALGVYILGSFLSFRWLSVAGIIVSLFHTSALLLVPPSPVWLYSRELERRGRGVLLSIRGGEVLAECSEISTALQTGRNSNTSLYGYCKLVLTCYRLKALSVGVLLAVGFINTGTDIMLAYTSPLLEGTGGLDPNIVAIGVPALGVIGGVLSLLLVEVCGRKPLLLSSGILVTMSLLSLAGFFLADEKVLGCATKRHNTTSGVCHWAVLWPGASIAVGRFGFQIGWGTVLYVIMGEIFPIRTKEVSAGVLQFALNTHAITVLTAFPYLAAAIGNGLTFLIMAGVNIVSCVCIVLFLPETKGLRTDEIEEIFQERSVLCGLSRTHSYTVQ